MSAQEAGPLQAGTMSSGKPDAHASRATLRRLSLRARLVLALLLASLPPFGLGIWLAWGSEMLWVVAGAGLLALAMGLAILRSASRPLSLLATRARRIADVPERPLRLLGLLRDDLPGDAAIAAALDKIEASLHEIQALNRISHMVASEADLGRMLAAIADEAVALLRADAGLIGLWDQEREAFHDVAASNMPIMFPGREFGPHESLSSQAARSREVIFVDDYACYPYRIRELGPMGLHAGIAAPMMVGGECKGVLVVHSVDPLRRFTDREGELLLTFANQAGAAFEKARLYQLALDQLEELTRARARLELESAELEQAFASMVHVQEEERSRIAADVHDGVVQTMVGSLCELQAAMAHFPGSLDMVEAKQVRARNLIRDSITELRRVIYDLRPIALDTAGLVPAVEILIQDLRQTSTARLEVRSSGNQCRLPADAEIAAYRIVQEAVCNALKHSEAQEVSVGLRFLEGMLQLSVHDDGKGFPVEEASVIYGKRAGLIGMKERARSLGGELEVVSVEGQGTTVTAQIPCPLRKRFGVTSRVRSEQSAAETGEAPPPAPRIVPRTCSDEPVPGRQA